MSLAACCGPDAMFLTWDSIFASGVVGIICGILLMVEAGAIAILLRRTAQTFWRRKFVIALVIAAAIWFAFAWQAMSAYHTLHIRLDLTLSDSMTIDQWQGLANTAIWVTLILLFSGVSYVWLERD